MRQFRRLSLLAACTALFCGMVAVPGVRAQAPASPSWQFYLTPYLWMSGIGGTLDTPDPRLPSQNVSASFGSILSHLDKIPIMGTFEAWHGRVGLIADIVAVSLRSGIDSGPRFPGGSASLTQIVGTAVLAARVVSLPDQSLDVGPGVRAIGMSAEFTVDPGRLQPGFTKSPGVSWADPILAVRYHYDFGPRWGLTAYGDIGAGTQSTLTWQLLGTVDYRVTDAIALRFGYRHMQFQYEGVALNQNIGMSGPILAATFRF